MPFELLDHHADAGVRGIGGTPEEAFAEGARGMFALMVELDRVEPREAVEIECRADSMEALFVAWLGELLLERDLKGMAFSKFEVQIGQADGGYLLRGRAWGESLDPERHGAIIEVKAATYSGLKSGRTPDGDYYVQCIVDL